MRQQLVAGLLHLLFKALYLLVDLLWIHLLIALRIRTQLVVQSIEPVTLLEKHLEGTAYLVVGSCHGALGLPHLAHLSGQLH